MKTKLTKEDISKMSESELLSLVASRLKGRVLFPRKLENAKRILQQINESGVQKPK
jgi:hypothetical protein